MSWWNKRRTDGPRVIERVKRSIHTGKPNPRPPKIIVSGGRIIAYELSSGRIVKADEPCCEDPMECRECWKPWPNAPGPPPLWWR